MTSVLLLNDLGKNTACNFRRGHSTDRQAYGRKDRTNLLLGEFGAAKVFNGGCHLLFAADHTQIGVPGRQNFADTQKVSLVIRRDHHIAGARLQIVVQIFIGITDKPIRGGEPLCGHKLRTVIQNTDVEIQMRRQCSNLSCHMASSADHQSGLGAEPFLPNQANICFLLQQGCNHTLIKGPVMAGNQRDLLVGIFFTKRFQIPFRNQPLHMDRRNNGVILDSKATLYQLQPVANLFGRTAQCVQPANHNDLVGMIRNDRLRIIWIFQRHALGTVSLYQHHICMVTNRGIGFFRQGFEFDAVGNSCHHIAVILQRLNDGIGIVREQRILFDEHMGGGRYQNRFILCTVLFRQLFQKRGLSSGTYNCQNHKRRSPLS